MLLDITANDQLELPRAKIRCLQIIEQVAKMSKGITEISVRGVICYKAAGLMDSTYNAYSTSVNAIMCS